MQYSSQYIFLIPLARTVNSEIERVIKGGEGQAVVIVDGQTRFCVVTRDVIGVIKI
jgi:hypothetical protein